MWKTVLVVLIDRGSMTGRFGRYNDGSCCEAISLAPNIDEGNVVVMTIDLLHFVKPTARDAQPRPGCGLFRCCFRYFFQAGGGDLSEFPLSTESVRLTRLANDAI